MEGKGQRHSTRAKEQQERRQRGAEQEREKQREGEKERRGELCCVCVRRGKEDRG